MLWMCVHFPALPLELFAARACAQNDEISGPRVVLQDNRVYMRNAAAKAAGLSPGSTLATAHSICEGLHYTHRDEAAELQRLQALADALYRFSGYVSVQAPDCVVLEIGGSLKLFGSYPALGRAAAGLCRTLGHAACVRVASTPLAAMALARSQQQRLADVPLCQAGLGLAGLGVEEAGKKPDNIIERFANMGVYTLGPLLDLPSKQLGQRFGKGLLRYLAQLTGDMPDPRQPITPAARFSQQLHLLEPLRNKGELYNHPASPMCKLAEEMQQWLITHQLGCEQLLWKFSSCNREATYLPVRFAKGRQNQQDFIHVSQLKLEQMALPAEILGVALSSRQLSPWLNESQGLFQNCRHGSAAQTAEADLSELVDELRARLGDHACQGIQSLAEHTPEQAWQGCAVDKVLSPRGKRRKAGPQTAVQKSAVQKAAAQKAAAKRPAPAGEPLPRHKHKRPLWLFAAARPVRLQDLTLLHGPERLQTQWWDVQRHGTHRDYYIARHALGVECWVFVDKQEDWYLHGYFG